MMLYRQIKWTMTSCMEWVRKDHGVVLTGLVHDTGEKRQWC